MPEDEKMPVGPVFLRCSLIRLGGVIASDEIQSGAEDPKLGEGIARQSRNMPMNSSQRFSMFLPEVSRSITCRMARPHR